MKIGVGGKLIAAVLGVMILGFLCIVLFGSSFALRRATENEKEKLYESANYLALSYEVNGGNVTQSQVESIAQALSAEVWLLDNEENIRTTSGDPLHQTSVPGFDPASRIGYSETGNFYGVFREEMLSVYAPLVLNVKVNGYAVLHRKMSSVQAEADRFLTGVYITYLLMIILLFGLGVFLYFIFVMPIRKTEKAVTEYANGNLAYEDTVRTGDEISVISKSAKDLANQLNTASSDQHRFLANISHDFRSPLTSIKGYLIAIQDGTIPPEDQSKYIDVVVSETERLHHLADGLLQVTKFEKGVILDCHDFDINELIHQVLLSFQGQADEKNLIFDVTMETETQNVYADGARIEQVVYNLIDNAVKFSHEDGVIEVTTQTERDKVLISVKDHGIGIEKESIGKIWNRFYKTDLSRGKDKKGTGLGLSIVRDIIQGHGEHIDVISTPGVGTEFIFSLPMEKSEANE